MSYRTVASAPAQALIMRPDLQLAQQLPLSPALAFRVWSLCHTPGGATALVAGIAKPLPRWSGFVLVPVVALSSVRAVTRCLAESDMFADRQIYCYMCAMA